MVIMEDILRSQINSGWIYPVDAVTDPKAFRQSGQGFLVPLKAGRLPSEIQRIEPPAIPQSMFELAQALSDDMMKISGVNEELLGSATDDKAGILSMLRQGAGLTTLQTVFDKADYSQRLYGKIRLEAIRKNFSKGKIRNILGKDYSQNFFLSHSQKYSIAVEEGNYSATQRQTELQQLLYFKEMGIPIADKSILRASFITNKSQVIEEMQEASQQQQQMQEQQAQVEQKKLDAEIAVKYSNAKSNLAKEKDLMASAHEKIANISKIQSEAQRAEHQSDLDMVKMMIGLEDMDIEQMRKSWEFAQAIKAANEMQPKQQEGVI